MLGMTSRTSISKACECHRVPGAGRLDEPAVPGFGCARVALDAGRPARDRALRLLGGAPALGQAAHALLEILPRALAPGPVVRRLLFDLCADEQKGERALRVRRREQDRHRPTLRLPEQGCSLGADRVHRPAHVVHALFERPERDVVGEPHSALVEQDQPRERGEALAEAASRRISPHRTEMREEAVDEHEVRRTASEDLVGEVHIAVSGVANVLHGHGDRI